MCTIFFFFFFLISQNYSFDFKNILRNVQMLARWVFVVDVTRGRRRSNLGVEVTSSKISVMRFRIGYNPI